jgi:hypothetical protein
MFKYIRKLILGYILRRATEKKMVDILQIRTKSINLTYVDLETDIKISNSFFLPVKILEIKTDLLNTAGMKVGLMHYNKIGKIKGKQDVVFTAHTKLSNITAFFNLISRFLTLNITMHSVGIARIKVLWFEVEIPVDDTFEIEPHQLKITEPLTSEQKAEIKEKQRIREEKYKLKKAERQQRRLERREEWERRRHERYLQIEENEDENSIEFTEEAPNTIYIDEHILDKPENGERTE